VAERDMMILLRGSSELSIDATTIKRKLPESLLLSLLFLHSDENTYEAYLEFDIHNRQHIFSAKNMLFVVNRAVVLST
jgi:hypothetical protein